MATILIVDDSATERAAAAQTLSGAGHKVTELADGTTLLEYAASSLPDLIILDVVMPNANGFQLCRKLKREARTKEIPVLLLTGKSGEADKTWGLSQGANGYLTKPVDDSTLKSTVQSLLAK